MGKIKKYLPTIFLSIFVIAFITTGFYLGFKAMLPKEDRQTVVTREALEYLNERYNEEFEVINFIAPSFNYASYIITAVRKGDPKDVEHSVTIHGWVSKKKNLFKKNKVTFYDNYAAVKLIPELKNYIANILRAECPDCKIYVSFYKEWIKQNSEIYSSVDDFIQKDDIWKKCMEIQIITFNTHIEDRSKLEKTSRKYAKSLFKNNFTDNATIYYISNFDIYAKLSDSLEKYDWSTDPSHKTSKYGDWGKDYVYVNCYIRNNKLLTELIELEDGFYGSN